MSQTAAKLATAGTPPTAGTQATVMKPATAGFAGAVPDQTWMPYTLQYSVSTDWKRK